MERQRLEGRIHEILERGISENTFVEFKRLLPPDPSKCACQIAAIANAARGEEVVWLVGVDEKAGVVGATPAELASWWNSVSSKFDGGAPAMGEVQVAI